MLFNIQALRALAALSVVVVHLAAMLAAAGWPTLPALVGHAGVDVFFVLSGFLMVHSVAVRPVSAWGFLLNRIVRVVPLYWLCTLVVVAVGLAVPTLLANTQVNIANVARSLLFIPYARSNGMVEPVLFLGWTLNYEMFFYAVFAISMLRTRGRSLWAAAAIATPVAIGTFAIPLAPVVRFYANPIMLEFVFGMMLAMLMGRQRSIPRPVAYLALVIGAAVLLGRFAVVPMAERTWWSGLPATVILAGAVSLERRGVIWNGRYIQALGASSYALYLVHPFVAQAMSKVMIGAFAGRPAMLRIGIAAIVVAVVAAALLVHHLFERPVTAWLRRLLCHAPSIVERAERQREPSASTLAPASLAIDRPRPREAA